PLFNFAYCVKILDNLCAVAGSERPRQGLDFVEDGIKHAVLFTQLSAAYGWIGGVTKQAFKDHPRIAFHRIRSRRVAPREGSAVETVAVITRDFARILEHQLEGW